MRPDTPPAATPTTAYAFFFMRDMQIGLDREFSFEALMDRLNADLANGLGNLASRSISMLQRYRDGVVPAGAPVDADDHQAEEMLKVAQNS
ncbi:MAG: class I tRNA ligase family protein, partial [Holophagaceae bacterium]|nr:class I tRNA ligase family protein [Holophagaceae bacterium]